MYFEVKHFYQQASRKKTKLLFSLQFKIFSINLFQFNLTPNLNLKILKKNYNKAIQV